jgi:hypothetical protein
MESWDLTNYPVLYMVAAFGGGFSAKAEPSIYKPTLPCREQSSAPSNPRQMICL